MAGEGHQRRRAWAEVRGKTRGKEDHRGGGQGERWTWQVREGVLLKREVGWQGQVEGHAEAEGEGWRNSTRERPKSQREGDRDS